MNPFQYNFTERLEIWHALRQRAAGMSLRDRCILVDDFWQHAPLVNHYLHVKDQTNWPNPWQLLADNTYCTVARALGICYTLHLCGDTDTRMIDVRDDHGSDYILVECAEYLMNYHPGTVVNNSLRDFQVREYIDISSCLSKIR